MRLDSTIDDLVDRLATLDLGQDLAGDLNISGLDLPTEHVDRTDEEKQIGLSDKLKAPHPPEERKFEDAVQEARAAAALVLVD